jgi:hypothetical protein
MHLRQIELPPANGDALAIDIRPKDPSSLRRSTEAFLPAICVPMPPYARSVPVFRNLKAVVHLVLGLMEAK